MSKTVEYELTFNDQIVELKFITIPRKGWFVEHIKPVVDFLKATIPASEREYNGHTFKWSFAVKYWSAIEFYLKAQGFSVVQMHQSTKPKVEVPREYTENFYHTASAASIPSESRESLATQLSTYLGVVITTQDLSELKKLYRAKARELHPDLGGDASKMSELNRLWTLYSSVGEMQ